MPAGRILLVEDNPVNRRLAEYLLTSRGYTVYQAGTGHEALRLARAHVPDLIVMDLQLPGMDGYEATRILKADAATRHIPVVALTAYAMPGDRERGFEAGCDSYLTKPLDSPELLRVVARYVESAAGPRSIDAPPGA